MEFLDEVYLDNDVRSYLVVLATILLVVIFRRFVSRKIASLIFPLIRRKWKHVPRQEFVNLIFKPLGWFISCSIAIVAIDKLNYPGAWNLSIYGHTLESLIQKTGICILIFTFTWVLLSLVNFIAFILEQKALQTAEKSDEQLIAFIRDFLKAVIVILSVLMVLKAAFNQDIGSILTGLSIVGAALALSAKESLENLIASFIIFFNKPFFTGDVLKVNQVTGTVENIGLRSTRIRTPDKTLITVPNKLMVDSVVDNWSMRTHRRAEIRLPLSTETPMSEVRDLLQDIRAYLSASSYPFTAQQAFLTDVSNAGYQLSIEFLTDAIPLDEFNQIREEVNLSVIGILEKKGVKMAVPDPGIAKM